MAPAAKTLRKQERFCLDTMENLLSFMQQYNEERDKYQIEGWKNRLNEIFGQFQSTRLKLELIEDDEDDEHEQEHRKVRDEFEKNYVKVIGFLAVAERKANPPSPPVVPAVASGSTNPMSNPIQSRIKLPEVKLPSFDGTILDWLAFRDSFKSLIDSNPNLSDVDKLSYLVGSLTKEAKRIVESIEITSANYSVAWELLQKRFDNKKLVVKTYLDALFSIEPIKRECYDSLVRLIDDFEQNLKMVQKMGIDTEGWSALLAYMVYIRLDSSTLKQWENHHKSTEVPQYKNLLDFLRNQATVLQSIAPPKSRSSEPPPTHRIQKPKISHIHSVVSSPSKPCPFCRQPSHSVFKCDVFRNSSVAERYELVKKKALCINCLSPDHQIKSCSSSACRVCGQKHHTMLHQQASNRNPNQSQAPKQIQSPPNSEQTQSQNVRSTSGVSNEPLPPATPVIPSVSTATSSLSHCSTSLVANVRQIPSTVLLQTALVKIVDSSGYLLWARALLDPASQLNVISERLVQRLQARKIKDHHTIGGIGRSTTVSTHSVLLSIHSHCTDFSADMKFHILSEITRDLPSNAVDTTNWKWPSDVVLADPKFHEPASVDMIIGMEVYYDLLLEGFVKLGPGKPVLQKTMLGWVVSGRVGLPQPSNPTVVAHVCSTQSLEDQLAKFWEIESCQSSSTMSVEESNCEAHFAATTTRDETGRFVVTLPKKLEVLHQLGKSYDIAKRRLLSMSRRLEANSSLKSAYSAFIEEYLQLGHMEEVPRDSPSPSVSYFLPHHCVVRPDSLTTKLRVVFDASCATDTGISLNDALMVGPVVQEDLVCITMRFRLQRYAIISDIEKMYRQISVISSDRPLQQILWIEQPSEPIRAFQLKTVTYGTSSAPYLATKCLQELAIQGQRSHPAASKVLTNDFYMDDMISGVNHVDEGKVLCTQLLELLQSAGLSLRKWSSNSPEILEHIPVELRDERSVLDLDSTSCVKTLGLKWTPASDELGFQVPKWNEEGVITKRIALSDSARLYDPLGLVGPVIVLAKCFMQELWKNKKTWDEPLEEELQQRWLQFRSELAAVETIAVPRWVIPIPQPVIIEAHGFSDASLRAYGACIYLRVVSSTGEISVHLLTSKSKVAPLGNSKKQKKISLPRLELSGALLLSHLFQKAQQSLKINLKCFYWVDSTIVLHWLSGTPSRWKTFVANRVSEIQHLTTNGVWGHVAGLENPADIISRGMLPTQLKETDLWWYGPTWLQQTSRFWPSHIRTSNDDFLAEDLEEQSIALPVQAQPSNPIISLRSSFPALVRLVTLLRRFLHNSKPANRQHRITGFIQAAELHQATNTLVRLAQAESFQEDLRSIRTSGQVKSTSKLKSLSPIIVDDILRIGGRLRNAPVSEDRKHPIILATHHPLTELIMTSYHQKLLHAGPQLLIASVREKFWPLRVRNLARKVVHGCLKCFRCKPTVTEQVMGDLPSERVTPALPFLNTGVDLCGPLYYRHASRKSTPVKCYVAIFVCLATKAVHVELVADLSTNAFIAALKRFVARRGRPAMIECDNAKNFLGASRTLAELHEQFRSQQHKHAVTTHCGEEGIHFKFIPPRSPNFGGLWEAAVKSFKKHFKATIGTAVLLKDDLETLLVQIESCLNSRPLTQLTSEPEDLEILTPGHFLIHRPLVSIPEPSYEELPTNHLDRYQQTQEFFRRIWKRWSTDYLSGLHPRTKWTRLRDNISIGTMVLLKDENLPPLKWRCGRVTGIYRGDDGNVRVVSVRTQDGEYRRAITKICVLPVQQPASTSDNDVLSKM